MADFDCFASNYPCKLPTASFSQSVTAWNSTIRLQWWWELIECVSVESALFEQRRSAIALIPVPSRAIYVAICLTCFIYGRSAIILTIFCVKKSILRVRDHSMTRRFQNSVTSFFHATRCFPLFILPICRAKPKTTLRKFKLRRNRFLGLKNTLWDMARLAALIHIGSNSY